MRRTTHHPRAGQRPARDTNPRWYHTIQRALSPSIRSIAALAGPALLLVAGLLTLSGARPLPAHADTRLITPPLAHAALRPAAPKSGGGPDQRYWMDPANGTAYAVFYRGDQQGSAGQFIFTLPNGDRLIGGFGDFQDPLQPSPANDGSLVQVSRCVDGTPDFGIVLPAGEATGSSFFAARGSPYQTVRYVLSAHLNASGFMAFATLDYVDAKTYAGSLCSEIAPYPYVMRAGCDLAQCRDPVESATQDAQHYDDAVVAAARDGGAGAWQAVWPLTATLIRGQYPQADFGAAMAAQERSVGRITQITTTSAPNIQLDVALQPFFSVTQDVTVSKDGKNTVTSVTSYYLLEGEQWQFWFSAS